MLRARGWHHHRCTRWTWESLQNYEWHLRHALEMCHEYTRRYDKVHVHQEFFEWAWENLYELGLADNGLMPFALATGDIVLTDPVETYREFYRETKTWAKWKHSETPHWWWN